MSTEAALAMTEAATTVSTSPEPAYFNREVSWIEFNHRVLEEAQDRRNPLLERVKFLAIFFSNLDEFFMIRVGGVKHQIAARVLNRSSDGLTPSEQLAAVRKATAPYFDAARKLLTEELIPDLAQQGIYVLDYHQLNEAQRSYVADYFHNRIFPVLTPLVFDPSHPFPHISNLSLNLAIVMQDIEDGEVFARVKVPEVLPRLIPLPQNLVEPLGTLGADVPPERRRAFVWLERAILAHLSALFPGVEVVEAYPFRVTRNADFEIEEDEAEDLLRTIEQGVRQRRFGETVRLTVDRAMPDRIQHLLATNLKIDPGEVEPVQGPQGAADLMVLTGLDRPDLKDPPVLPYVPPGLRSRAGIFAAIRQQDHLLHHPYDSFIPIVDFIQAAAEDPDVLAIKQTLYRVGASSPVVKMLMQARERGKQVTVLVELKARFDEENNITWARALERVGVHVVYGLLGLKTHAKIALVVRKEGEAIRRYVHLGTGNYNVATSRIYTDFGFFTSRPEIGADVSELFNYLTGYSRQSQYRKLLVAPVNMRRRILELIDQEAAVHADAAKAGGAGGGRLIFKMNSLVDEKVIEALYRASRAGVEIDLIVRGMCCLRPGVPGLSESIRVRSIVGPHLEHSRIYYFRGGGEERLYLGSADLMARNLDRRVETLFPVEDPQQIRHLRDNVLEVFLKDNRRARVLQTDGSYLRLESLEGEVAIDSQKLWRTPGP